MGDLGKLLLWVPKTTFRNRTRSTLTLGAAAIAFFLLATMGSMVAALRGWEKTSADHKVLAVQSSTSHASALPATHEKFLRTLSSVTTVQKIIWLGGYYQDPANTFANFACDADAMRETYAEWSFPEPSFRAFLEDPTGALVERRLARKYGWKEGDRITLLGCSMGVVPELTVRCLFEGALDALFFHWKYFDQLTGESGVAGMFLVKARSRSDVPGLIRVIDEHFANSPAPTLSMTDQEFARRMRTLSGDFERLLVNLMRLMVATLVLVGANTMAMGARARANDVALMRTLGFTRASVGGLVAGEAVLLSLSGAVLGVLLAVFLLNGVGIHLPQMRSDPIVTWRTAGWLFLLACAIGSVSGAIPAWNAARGTVVEGLRRVI